MENRPKVERRHSRSRSPIRTEEAKKLGGGGPRRGGPTGGLSFFLILLVFAISNLKTCKRLVKCVRNLRSLAWIGQSCHVASS